MTNLHFLIISVLTSLIGFFVYIRGKEKQANQTFAVISNSAAIWIMCLYLISNTQTHQHVLLLAKIAYAFGMIPPAALLHFVYVYPNKSITLQKQLVIYIPAVMMFGICLSSWVVNDCQVQPWGVKAIAGKGIGLVIGYFAVYLFMIIQKTLIRYQKSNKIQKRQWIFIMVALPLPVLHILLTNIVLPRVGFEQAYKWGPFAALEMVIGYAVYKHYYYDLKTALSKVLVYLLLAVSISCEYFLSVLLIHMSLDLGYFSTLNIIMSLFVVSLTVGFLQKTFRRVVGQWLYANKYRSLDSIEALCDQVSYTDPLEKILSKLLEAIIDNVKFKHAAIYLKKQSFSSGYEMIMLKGEAPVNIPLVMAESEFVVSNFKNGNRVIDTEKVRHYCEHIGSVGEEQFKWLDYLDNVLGASWITPLRIKKKIIGFVVFGEKKNGEPITDYEKGFVKSLSRELSNIVENNKLYIETLKNERLAMIGTMSSSFAHEIRNPLASINSYIDLLRNKTDDPEFVDQFFKIIPSEIKRIDSLTNDLLNFARANEPAFEEIDLEELVQRAVELMANKVKKKGIQIVVNVNSVEAIYADKQQIYQTILNILLNAVHAVEEEGEISISVYKNETFAIVAIKDNGPGIEENDQHRIFEPFFSTKIYGTGLGLTTCKRIIEAHKGYINVESQEDHGSTFEVHLPL